MKHILVPVDFSDCSKQALRYALMLAERAGAELHLVHIQGVPMTDPYMPVSTADLIDEEQREQLKQHLESVVTELGSEEALAEAVKAVPIHAELKTGFASGEINRMADEVQAEWIIMGTRGASGLSSTLLGSVTSAVLNHSERPVLVIPDSATFKGVEHIAFAFDQVPDRSELVEELIMIAEYFKARLHLIHVVTDRQPAHAAAGATLGAFLDTGYEKTITAETIHGDDVEESLQRYCDHHGIDMLIMLRHHRNFLQRLFHRSQTRLMTLHSHIPLLIYPEKS